MKTLEELYQIKEFKEAMDTLTEEQRKQTEEDLKKILESFNRNVVEPLLKIIPPNT